MTGKKDRKKPPDHPGEGRRLRPGGEVEHGRAHAPHRRHGHPLQARGAEARALPVRREDDDQGGEAMPDGEVPCLKTFYNHIEAGDIGVFRGQTPCHPGRRRRPRQPAHEARTVPGRRQLKDRPKEAKELGHFEMDTVISR